MYTTCISINTQFLLFIGKLQGGPNSYPLLVHLVYVIILRSNCLYERYEQYNHIIYPPLSMVNFFLDQKTDSEITSVLKNCRLRSTRPVDLVMQKIQTKLTSS